MLNHFHKRLYQRIQSAVFAINPQLLGDGNRLAWTNLGAWCCPDDAYITAAQRLAQYIGEGLSLSETDQVLDIGCGHGASLQYWHRHFAVQYIVAMELQAQCCDKLWRSQLPYLKQVLNQSVFDQHTTRKIAQFDVVLSVDAAYHYPLRNYLQAIQPWLKPGGRTGFHFLLKSDGFNSLSMQQQKQIGQKLKWAKVDVGLLHDQTSAHSTLQAYGFEKIEIMDLTDQVFKGFSGYFFAQKFRWQEQLSLDYLKIKMTAQLCAYLAAQGQIRYVQITAQKMLSN